eukprot:CAMPEP_0114250556 /NCGR_PEP_ID=MMETSP0058-20121206/14765_1 /TAXON_ID=36894 /ORGANISM="Pyramimonas parkeae, CCMP726" /LENGTH=490 /DNA_ID=CAMNT_0001364229 /DNA_START=223 /DNA_END=1695 /DNA_ORIENTATION=-
MVCENHLRHNQVLLVRGYGGYARHKHRHMQVSANAASSGNIETEDRGAISDGQALYPNLNFEWRPKLQLVEKVITVFFGLALTSAVVTMRQRWTVVLRSFHPLDWAILVGVFAAGVFAGRTLLLEKQQEAHLITPQEAADSDSLFRVVDGINVHYKRRPAMITQAAARPWAAALWHGFGANTYSWQMKVLDELARALGEGALVVAHDCPGFGLTERVEDSSKYTVENNARVGRSLLEAEMDQLPASNAQRRRLYMGHSMGGWAAAMAAAQAWEEGEPPAALVLVAPALVPSNSPNRRAAPAVLRCGSVLVQVALRAALSLIFKVFVRPVLLQVLRTQVRSARFWRLGLQGAWHNRQGVDANVVDGYRRPSKVQGWDRGMLRFVEANALGADRWEDIKTKLTKAWDPTTEADTTLTEKLAKLSASGVPILIVHGKQDALVPFRNSVRLASIVGAELCELEDCGHIPFEECPDRFMKIMKSFIAAHKTTQSP